MIDDIKKAEVESLDLASMLALKSHVDTKIAALEPLAPTSGTVEVWLREARAFRDHILGHAVKSRLEGAISSEIFWLVVDEALDKLSNDQVAMLARVSPILWKVVDSGWTMELGIADKIRCGYLSAAQVERVIDPKNKFFGDDNIAKHLLNGAWLLSTSFKLRGRSDHPGNAASRLAGAVEEIHSEFEEALTELFRQTGEVVYGPAKALRASLADQAKAKPNSILSVMSIEHRSAAKDRDSEIEEAMREIRIISGIRGGASSTVEAKWRGRWYAVKVLATRDSGDRYVHFIGYAPEWDEWIEPSRLRTRTELQEGDQAWVRWKGLEYPARILEVGQGERSGAVRVHWLGFSTSNDANWISASSVAGHGP